MRSSAPRRSLLRAHLLLAAALAAPLARAPTPLAAASARAAEAIPTAAEALGATALEETLVVTATLREEERRDVPATVRVIGGEEAAARHGESIAELLATVPGAHLASTGGPGQQASLFVRGSESDQALVLWNGVPLNTPFDGAFNAAFLSTDGLERIEVVPGPFSALYGGSALGGVVQVLTAPRPGARVELEAGEQAHRRVTLTAGRELGPVSATLTGHLRASDGALVHERYEGREGVLRLGWRPRPSLEVGGLLRAQRADTSHPFNGVGSSRHRETDVEERQWTLPVELVLGAWELTGSLAQTRFDAAFRDPDDPFFFTSNDTLSRSARGRAVATRRHGRGWWAAGVEGERLEASNRTSFGSNLDGARQLNRAAFAQAHFEGARWAVDLGLRHDDNDVYGSATSPRLGLAWAALPLLRLRASYGEGFRAPSFVDLFFPFFGNPELEPERGRSAELGLELRRGSWRLDLATFVNRQRDLIASDPLTFRAVNVARSESRGVEAEVALRRSDWELRAGGTLLAVEDLTTGQPLLRRPEQSAYLVTTARPGRATLSLAAVWVGERPDVHPVTFVQGVRNPAYWTVDLAASWQARAWLAPYLRLQNALDEAYQPVLGYPAVGRRLIGGVRVSR